MAAGARHARRITRGVSETCQGPLSYHFPRRRAISSLRTPLTLPSRPHNHFAPRRCVTALTQHADCVSPCIQYTLPLAMRSFSHTLERRIPALDSPLRSSQRFTSFVWPWSDRDDATQWLFQHRHPICTILISHASPRLRSCFSELPTIHNATPDPFPSHVTLQFDARERSCYARVVAYGTLPSLLNTVYLLFSLNSVFSIPVPLFTRPTFCRQFFF